MQVVELCGLNSTRFISNVFPIPTGNDIFAVMGVPTSIFDAERPDLEKLECPLPMVSCLGRVVFRKAFFVTVSGAVVSELSNMGLNHLYIFESLSKS